MTTDKYLKNQCLYCKVGQSQCKTSFDKTNKSMICLLKMPTQINRKRNATAIKYPFRISSNYSHAS